MRRELAAGASVRALVINDTRGLGHVGCALVMRQLTEGCRQAGISISAMLRPGRYLEQRVRAHLSKCDVVIINGEGTMHHDRRAALAISRAGILAARNGRHVALINTVWEGNQMANELLNHCALIRTRESMSQREVENAGAVAAVVPDLMLSAMPSELFAEQPASDREVVVTDDVRLDLSLLLARYARTRGHQFFTFARPRLSAPPDWLKAGRVALEARSLRRLSLRRLQSITKAEVLVTGRFHGVCLSMLARRPVVALPSNTHKTHGLINDAQLGPAARVCNGTPEQPLTLAAIDRAVVDVQASAADRGERLSFERACEQYLAAAKTKASEMFREIALLR